MKKIITLLIMLSLFSYMQAENVPAERALKIATQYYRLSDHTSLRSGTENPLTLVYTEKVDAVNLRSSASPDAYFYVFNTAEGDGFIIVSGDDRACPVLGSSFKGAFDPDSLPANLKAWLKHYGEEIAWMLKENPRLPSDPEWAKLETGVSQAGIELRKTTDLKTAEWGQGDPYNQSCPTLAGERTVTGCVATAIAVVIKYHADNGYEAKGTGNYSYTWEAGKKTLSATFGSYDFASMPDKTSLYKNSTQRAAVSKLMYHCAIAAESEFGVDGTSSDTFYAFTGLTNYFGFDKRYMRYVQKENYTDLEWNAIIRREIDGKRPVIYGGNAGDSGHQFVCDGYNNDTYYSINWGWDGSYNGYYRLTSLKAGSNPNYRDDQEMIIGIQKSVTPNASNIIYYGPDGGLDVILIGRHPFIVYANSLLHRSYSTFNGHLGIALTDSKGNIKKIVGEREDQEMEFGYSYRKSFILDEFTFLDTDMLRCVSSKDNGKTWEVIYGENDFALGARDYYPMPVETIAPQAIHVRSIPNGIEIDSPASETVHVYTLAGQLVFSGEKKAGKATFSVSLPRGVVIVGGSNWTEKIPVR
ncbi:MAG: C10 family peptidase [Tannerella sp.]|nr:C10 family peptidase [Tannerella sp.]